MTINQTINWVKKGNNAMCDYRSDAKKVARNVGRKEEIVNHTLINNYNDGDYFRHFHPNNKRNHQHIWYIFSR